MERVGRAGAVVPLAIIVLFVVLDAVAVPGQTVLGLVVIAPLLAASLLGRRATLLYAALAFVVAMLLGIVDNQYSPEAWPTQATRLFGVALGGLIAFTACSARLEREIQLQTLAAEMTLAQARVRDAESMARLAEWLQRSLLGETLHVPEVEIATRYVPAADHVKIGGDWYDTFRTPAGTAVVVIGDVAGHDGAAAATMALVRNMLRGIGQVLLEPPGTLLTALDRALHNLTPGTLATMILAEIGRDPTREGAPLVLRWSNAGHPPPLMISGDGPPRLLEHEADLLLGVDPDTHRVDHECVLQTGDTVVLFTDGLVERRGTSIDEGLRRLQDIAGAAGEVSLAELCELLLTGRGEQPDDDIAVLALRARPGPSSEP